MKQAVFTKSLTVSIPPEHYDQIKKITDEEQISLAQFVRKAVEKALTTNQPKEENM